MKIIALVGKTSTGKDTAARYLKETFGIEPIVSFTTRPMRDCETEGVEHYFVSEEKMDELVKDKANLLAFVQFPKTGHRYCASTSNLKGDEIKSYIIDPSGLKWLRENRPDVEVYSIYFHLDEGIIKERALSRGDREIDILARLESERAMFDKFDYDKEWDAKIYSHNTFSFVQQQLEAIMEIKGITKK